MCGKFVKAGLMAIVGVLVSAQGALANPGSADVSLTATERGSSARVRLRFVYTAESAVTSTRGCKLTIRGCTYETGSSECERSRVVGRKTLARGKRKSTSIVILPTIDVASESESQILAMQVRTKCPGSAAFDSDVDAANVSCDGGVTASQFLTQLRTALED